MAAILRPSRLVLRLTEGQDALIRRAAEIEGKTIADFAVASAVAHAQDVLADRRMFQLAAADWADFSELLDRPVVVDKARLAQLLSQPSVVDE